MGRLFPGLDSAMNLHPMLVHFPIVFWCTALLFGALWAWRGDERLWVFGRSAIRLSGRSAGSLSAR